MARLAQAWSHWMTQRLARPVVHSIAHSVAHSFDMLRERPMRFGYVLMALVLGVVVFSLSDYLPAPYDMGH